MGKTFKLKRKLIYTIISISLFIVLGCPRPPRESLIFAEHHKKRNNYELKLLDNKLNLKIGSKGNLNVDRKRYSMSLWFNIDYSKLNEKIRFSPEYIEVYINNYKLTKVQVQREVLIKSQKGKKSNYESSNYYINLNTVQLEQLLQESHEILIVLDKFISINDQFIGIDTIKAIDPTILKRPNHSKLNLPLGMVPY